jgi:L-iditol 2-dehydrogenase
MKALCYTGKGRVELVDLPRPEPGEGEVVIALFACGVCGTDIKKIDAGLLAPPRVFGHEIAGEIASVGRGVTRFREGDRVVAHHHIPCRQCFYCARRLYAQCVTYKRNGTSAGFEPSGGGFAEFIRAEKHIVDLGLIPIPGGVEAEVATFVEPVNTCLKAVRKAAPRSAETVFVVGQGPIGSILMQLARLDGARVLASDLSAFRLALARRLGAETHDAEPPGSSVVEWVRRETEGRGADATFLAATGQQALDAAIAATRPGGRIVAFSATSSGERYEVDLGALAAAEKDLLNAYSASIDVQEEAKDAVFSRKLDVASLISDLFPLDRAPEALDRFRRPGPETLKVIVTMNRPR